MSMFSLQDDLIRQMKQFETMKHELRNTLPREMASAVNLMAHPMAGAAALSALGLGMASQGFGIWMGAVASAAEASRRMFAPVADVATPVAGKKPAAKAGRTARALIDEAQSLAQEIGEKASESVAVAAEPVVAAETAVAEAVDAFVQPKAIDRPDAPDDLKMISGIGPKLEKVLNSLGVWTFAQIADWTAQEIGWVDDYLSFRGRIGRDDWIGQARARIGQGG